MNEGICYERIDKNGNRTGLKKETGMTKPNQLTHQKRIQVKYKSVNTSLYLCVFSIYPNEQRERK